MDPVETLETLLAENQQTTERTPYLEVAAGAMHTAIANLTHHAAELQRRAEAQAAPETHES